MADNDLVKMVQENFRNLRSDMGRRLDRIESKVDGLVSNDDCKQIRENCLRNQVVVNKELSLRKILTIGGIITGTITASTTAVATIFKIFYS